MNNLNSLEPMIREKLLSGKVLIEWRHDLCAEITKKRYINDQEVMRLAHAEIVSLFFPQETSDESDEINSETSDKSSKFLRLSRNSFMIVVPKVLADDISFSLKEILKYLL